MKVTVRVPATSANLGPGFDCFGLAVALYNEIVVTTDVPFSVTLGGEGVDRLPRDRGNLVYRTIERFYAQEIGHPPPDLSISTHNSIPMCGGLGSSSAAIVGGLLAANTLTGEPLSRASVVRLATQIEGHPDNVAPALLGGFVIAVGDGDDLMTVTMPLPAGLRAVVFAPDFPMSTQEARRLLPASVPRVDALFNASRTALWVAAISTGRLDLLRTACEDRLHQPYRQAMFPALPRLIDGALNAGAVGAFLSGAGAAVMALYTGAPERIASAMCRVAADARVSGRVLFVDLAASGAEVVSVSP